MRHFNIFPSMLSGPALVVALSGCLAGPGFLKQGDKATQVNTSSQVSAVIVASENGVVTGALTAGADSTQILEAASDSNIAGAAVAFPPGSLAIDTNITIEEGASLASDSVAEELGLGAAALDAASGAVVVSAADDINALQPFTVAIGLSGASLTQQDTSRMVVVYRVKKAGEGYFTGVIPNSLLTFDGGTVKFQTQFFGSFQVVISQETISTAKEVATTTQVTTKRDEVALPEVGSLKLSFADRSSVQVSWLSGGGSTDHFLVAYRGDTAPTTCSSAQLKVTDLSKTEAKISGLTAGSRYGIRVCAVDGNGRISAGTTIDARTSSEVQLGSFAFDLPAIPPGMRVPLRSDLKLGWSASANALDYEVYFTSDSACKNLLGTKTVVVSNFIDSDVKTQPEGFAFLCVTARRGSQRLTAPSIPVDIDRTTVHFAYRKTVNGSDTEIRYVKVEGDYIDSIVVDEGTANGDDNLKVKLDLTVDPTGTPFISYVKETVSSTEYMIAKINDGVAYPSLVTGAASNSAISTTPNGELFSAIRDSSNNVVTYTGPYNDLTELIVGYAALDGLDVTMGPDGIEHAVFVSDGEVKYARPTPSSWFTEGVSTPLAAAGISCSETFAPSIDLDASGKAAIAFVCKSSSTCKLVTGIRNTADSAFAFVNHGTIDSSASCYSYDFAVLKPSVLLAPDGLVKVAYTDRDNGRIHLMTHGSGNTWTNTVIHQNPNVTGGATLGFDRRGRPHVFFVTTDSGVVTLNLLFEPYSSIGPTSTPKVIDSDISGLGDIAITGMPGRGGWAPSGALAPANLN